MSLLLDLLYPQPNYILSQSKVKSVSVLAGFDGVLSLFSYHPPIKDIISDIKYNFVTDFIPQLIDYSAVTLKNLYPNLLSYWQENNFILVPVPLHNFRQNWRGFNQSVLLGSLLASRLHLDFNSSLVSKTRYTPSQASLSDKQIRHTNTSHSFVLNYSPPPNIILFDDVITTGSTIKSLASAFPPTTSLWALSIAG